MTPADTPMNRCYQLTAPERGALVAKDIVDPGPGEVLMRVVANGVCASDLPDWISGPGEALLELGHEPVGTVAATGPGVDLPAGTWITGRIVPSYSEFALADLRDIVVVPDGLDPRLALGEPLGCVAEGLRRTPVQLADRVAVVGLGFMGLIMVQLLARNATATIVGIDIREDSRAASLRCGADVCYHPNDLPPRLADNDVMHGRQGFDLVVEASGTQPGLDLSGALVRPHGVISLLGYHQSPRVVDVGAWNWKAIDVVNAHVRDRDRLRDSTRRGLELAATGKLDLASLITHRFPLDRIDDAFAAMRSKPAGFIKAAIVVADL